VVADIWHQGSEIERDNRRTSSPQPFKALLQIGSSRYQELIATLRREIEKLEAEGAMGRKRYSAAHTDFVDG
jgi:uncharacterized small protein (DUF1192 family)